MVIIHAKDVSDLGTQLFHVVSVSLLAELAEAAEILADLRCGDSHFLTERMGGDSDDSAILQVGEVTIIPRQTANDGV